MKIDKYVAVEVRAFGQGMQKMFEGMAEVFGSIGADEPDRQILEKAKWKHEGNAAGVPVAEDDKVETDRDSAVPDAETAETDEETKTEEARVEDTPDEDASSDAEPADTPAEEAPVERVSEQAPVKKKETSITKEDIQKIIVQKIKKDRDNSTKIGELLKTYGAANVSDLLESQYEAFLMEIAAF